MKHKLMAASRRATPRSPGSKGGSRSTRTRRAALGRQARPGRGGQDPVRGGGETTAEPKPGGCRRRCKGYQERRSRPWPSATSPPAIVNIPIKPRASRPAGPLGGEAAATLPMVHRHRRCQGRRHHDRAPATPAPNGAAPLRRHHRRIVNRIIEYFFTLGLSILGCGREANRLDVGARPAHPTQRTMRPSSPPPPPCRPPRP